MDTKFLCIVAPDPDYPGEHEWHVECLAKSAIVKRDQRSAALKTFYAGDVIDVVEFLNEALRIDTIDWQRGYGGHHLTEDAVALLKADSTRAT